MLRIIPSAAAAVGLLSVPVAVAQMQPLSAQEFVDWAASSDMFEIQSSILALERVSSAEVRRFAQMMIADHATASEKLKSLAALEGLTAPAAMARKYQEQLDELLRADEMRFSSAYINAQVAVHEEALTLMSSYAERGDINALKEHAAQMRPKIHMHYERVQQIDKKM